MFMRSFAAILLVVFGFYSQGVVARTGPRLRSPQAILIDAHTGTVLFANDADSPTPPGAITRLLTAYKVFKVMESGQISLSTRFPLSEDAFVRAARMTRQGGGSMFLEQGEYASVEDLIQGLIVLGANDAALALAEGISGSEANFSRDLNTLALDMGLEHTTIINATGQPHAAQWMSLRDMAVISRRLILDFPEHYHFFGQREFSFRPESQTNLDNLNKLLWIMPGADGLHVSRSARGGYGGTFSIERGSRRLIAATNMLRTPNANFERYLDARALLEYGLRTFSNFVFYDPGVEIIRVPVWFGARGHVALGPDRPIMITAPAGSRPEGSLRITYLSPVVAPVGQGDVLGQGVLYIGGNEIDRFDLVAMRNVRRTQLFGRTWANIRALIQDTRGPQ